jgi:hypothetical protein
MEKVATAIIRMVAVRMRFRPTRSPSRPSSTPPIGRTAKATAKAVRL